MAEQGPPGQTKAQEGNTQSRTRDTCPGRSMGTLPGEVGLDLAGDVTNNKKSFYRYIGHKKSIKESILPTINNTGELVTWRRLKHSAIFFASVFTRIHSSNISQVPEPQGGDCGNTFLAMGREDQV